MQIGSIETDSQFTKSRNWRALLAITLRLAVIGALSWSLFWFKKERDTPAAIAKQILSMLRAGIQD